MAEPSLVFITNSKSQTIGGWVEFLICLDIRNTYLLIIYTTLQIVQSYLNKPSPPIVDWNMSGIDSKCRGQTHKTCYLRWVGGILPFLTTKTSKVIGNIWNSRMKFIKFNCFFGLWLWRVCVDWGGGGGNYKPGHWSDISDTKSTQSYLWMHQSLILLSSRSAKKIWIRSNICNEC